MNLSNGYSYDSNPYIALSNLDSWVNNSNTGYSYTPLDMSGWTSSPQSFGSSYYDSITSGLGNLWDWGNSTIGSGQNAMSGFGLAFKGLEALANYQNQKKALKLAKEQLAQNKAVSKANFLNQGTDWLNQNLWQVQALEGWDKGAGAERAANVLSGLNQLNQAGSTLGMGDNAFGSQAEALKKYQNLQNTPQENN